MINDVPLNVVQAFADFLYEGVLSKMAIDDLFLLLELAHRYDIQPLEIQVTNTELYTFT